jgi:hypothetical protein
MAEKKVSSSGGDGGAAAAVDRAASLLEAKDHEAAASLADEVLDNANRSVLAQAALIRGKALLQPLVDQIKNSESEAGYPAKEAFRPAWQDVMLALSLEPDNAEAQAQLAKLNRLAESFSNPDASAAASAAATAATSTDSATDISSSIGSTSATDTATSATDTAAAAAPMKEHNGLPHDVIVVGAGASGVGLGVMLNKAFGIPPERVLVVERGDAVGESFRRWPKEMRFISPSFNQQGWTESFDLNSVAYGTSPAFTLHAEHPSGEQYATYLSALAENAELNVRCGTDVKAVRPLPAEEGGGFEVEVAPWVPPSSSSSSSSPKEGSGGSQAEAGDVPVVPDGSPVEMEVLRSRYVVWAAGEFQYPRSRKTWRVGGRSLDGPLFPGAEHCRHNSAVSSWKDLEGDDFVVIGGYESGMDAAYNLATTGKRCTVVSSTAFWRVTTDDPSTELAPYTMERVRAACATKTPPKLLAPLRVTAVETHEDGGFLVRAIYGAPEEAAEEASNANAPWRAAFLPSPAEETPAEGSEVTLRTPQAPVLCAGFEGSVALGAAKDLFEFAGSSGGRGESEESEEEEVEEEEGENEEDDDEEEEEEAERRRRVRDFVLSQGFEAEGAISGEAHPVWRFRIGEKVKARTGRPPTGWSTGTVVAHDHEEAGVGVCPYQIRLDDEAGTLIFAPYDEDVCVRAAAASAAAASAKPAAGGGGCLDGAPLLNDFDESTKTPGLFLVGPQVVHGSLSFCFVYKYRQRFGIVADAIARGLGLDTHGTVEAMRKSNMFLDDFSCCKGACGESC